MPLAAKVWGKLKLAVSLAIGALKEWIRDRCDAIAGGLAFNGLLAIAPLLGVVLLLVDELFGQAWTAAHLRPMLESWLGSDRMKALEFLLARVDTLSGKGLLEVVIAAAVTLAVGAASFFLMLKTAMEAVWGVRRGSAGIKQQMLDRIRGWLLAAGSLLIVLGALVLIAAAYSWLGQAPRLSPAWVALRGAWALTVFLMFWAIASFWLKALLPLKLTRRQILPWAAGIAAMHLLGRFALSWHIAPVNASPEAELAEAILLTVIWMYYASVVFLYGVELMRVSLERFNCLTPAQRAQLAGKHQRAMDA